ncbi:MAG: hypothetical protein JNL41_15965 [Phenylobacterium sp.]|uniref:2-keto-4-pentenoate hydratase n=1 Tax=Phenylobacterium sp. TaxID=1871053 RepID=UPI001A42E0C3|nr:hypothetical protein [Phenylobacterium sp.]MBL8555771.1 hypothetical protein [Phenylobacterium sp.]
MSAPRFGAAAAALAIAGGLVSCATPQTPEAAYLRGFDQAEAAARPFAPVTDTLPSMTLDEAYGLQRRLIARRVSRGDRVAGWKGGLMSAASLKARNVTAPLVGAMFASGRTQSGDTISLCSYRKASFEMKLGFVFREAVRTPPADVAALSRSVSDVLPVVDLPDIGYRDPDRYGAVDMVAANVSAARYVRGDGRPGAGLDLDGLRVAMTRDGQPLTSGLGRESLGGQWESLLAVVRQLHASGRSIAPGDVVITGKIGDRGWLPPGAYAADYGPLGTVRFAVRACPTP